VKDASSTAGDLQLHEQAEAGYKQVLKVPSCSHSGAEICMLTLIAQLKLQRRPKDYYRVLGVCASSSERVLRRTYRMLSLRHHPENGGCAVLFDLVRWFNSLLTVSDRQLTNVSMHCKSAGQHAKNRMLDVSDMPSRTWQISEAYVVLGNRHRRKVYDSLCSRMPSTSNVEHVAAVASATSPGTGVCHLHCCVGCPKQ
jgi:hypothetical protein